MNAEQQYEKFIEDCKQALVECNNHERQLLKCIELHEACYNQTKQIFANDNDTSFIWTSYYNGMLHNLEKIIKTDKFELNHAKSMKMDCEKVINEHANRSKTVNGFRDLAEMI